MHVVKAEKNENTYVPYLDCYIEKDKEVFTRFFHFNKK